MCLPKDIVVSALIVIIVEGTTVYSGALPTYDLIRDVTEYGTPSHIRSEDRTFRNHFYNPILAERFYRKQNENQGKEWTPAILNDQYPIKRNFAPPPKMPTVDDGSEQEPLNTLSPEIELVEDIHTNPMTASGTMYKPGEVTDGYNQGSSKRQQHWEMTSNHVGRSAASEPILLRLYHQ